MALTDNIIAYWKLDESSGNAADSVGSKTLTNTSVTYNAGKINNCATFNGSTSYLSSGWTTEPTDTWTIAFRFYNNNSANGCRALGRGDTTLSASALQFCYSVFTAGKWSWLIRNADGADSSITYTTSLSNNTRYFIVVTGSTSSGYRCYLNGNSTPEATNTTGRTLGLREFLIGKPNNDASYATCSVDEVGYWSRVLSTSEMAELYNSGNGLSYPFTSTTNITNSFNFF